MARMMSRTFLKVSLAHNGQRSHSPQQPHAATRIVTCAQMTHAQGMEVDPAHVILLAGAGAILDSLFW